MKKYEGTKCYISVAEIIEEAGYKVYKPRIGGLGKALMAASRENPKDKWLKEQLDIMFTGIRREDRKKGRKNGRSKK